MLWRKWNFNKLNGYFVEDTTTKTITDETEVSTSYIGSGSVFDIMPPYEVKYCCERTL